MNSYTAVEFIKENSKFREYFEERAKEHVGAVALDLPLSVLWERIPQTDLPDFPIICHMALKVFDWEKIDGVFYAEKTLIGGVYVGVPVNHKTNYPLREYCPDYIGLHNC